MPPHPSNWSAEKREELEKDNPGFIPGLWGLNFSFSKKRIENTKGVVAGSLGELVERKVSDALDFNPTSLITLFLNKEAWDTYTHIVIYSKIKESIMQNLW